MVAEAYHYTLSLYRPDGTPVGQVALDGALAVDWAPAEECARFLALRRLGPSAAAGGRGGEPAIEPVWHTTLHAPYVEGFQVCIGAPPDATSVAFGSGYFKPVAALAAAHFVREGAIDKGDRVVSVAAAFPRDAARVETGALDLAAEDVSPPPRLCDGDLAARSRRGRAVGPPAGGDMPVFVPAAVLDEAAALARRAGDAEAGGVLVGRLCRDAGAREIYADVTVQIPARHTTATSSRLTFTADTWTDVRQAIALRGADEMLLGWWHSHPVRVWCRECPPEKQAVCSLAAGFFSEHDRALHRAVFPGAQSVGLLVNDIAAGPTFSFFGWRQGELVARGFSVLGDDRGAIVYGGTPRPASVEAAAEGRSEGSADDVRCTAAGA